MHVNINGRDIYYQDLGTGLPVVCLPPFPFDHTFYQGQHELRDTFRLIFPDYRGVGRSGYTLGPYSMQMLAEDLLDLFDQLKLQQAVVMGVSLGVYVALALYALAPARVRGLILADSRSESDTPELSKKRTLTADALLAKGTEVLLTRVAALFGKTTHAERPALVKIMQARVANASPHGLAQLTLGMAERPDRGSLLPEIKVPTLVVCGAEDTVSPPAGMQQLAERIPNADFGLVAQAGHLAPLEQPDHFNRLVRGFLEKL